MSAGIGTKLRVAFSRTVEAVAPAPDAAAAARAAVSLHGGGIAATLSYFPAWDGVPDGIVTACGALSRALNGTVPGTCLAIKASPLHFDKDLLRAVATPASAVGMTVVFDALTHAQAGPTLDLVEWLAGEYGTSGTALPARWQRSAADAERLRDAPVRIRLVKGEWADPDSDAGDLSAAFLELVHLLAGRSAPVGVATHDPALARAALEILKASGTPCELEQLRGLPMKRSSRVAGELGVPVRLYWPFGPGWWPYAAEKLVERPYLPKWWMQDRF
ncbi:proline dehydrogenase [Novosphingobium sp. PhB165]|uniref:proline dehydrogenase n=1 Tax=Novosphingobium sp. PhB165 TaxID=2485105 RepID=UPI00104B72F0|nr:proline dehydrogenase [Novosphingobium sp. PhB165]TCM17955.1 proline dehydrogenase [Novosphingobium sp. PhB165]